MGSTTAGVSASPTEAEALEVFIRSFLQDLHTAMPAKVVEYDAEKQTIVAQPMTNRAIETIDGGELAERLPTIPDVPVAFPRSSAMFLSFPLEPGDAVMLVFSMRSLDTYLASQGKEPVDPIDFRIHDITDAVAFPGVYPAARALKDISTANLVLGNDEGGLQLHITPDGKLEIKVDGDADEVVALGNALQQFYETSLKPWFDTHVHPTGVGPSGPSTVPSPAFDTGILSSVVSVKGG